MNKYYSKLQLQRKRKETTLNQMEGLFYYSKEYKYLKEFDMLIIVLKNILHQK
jgi:hypothetical protein